ncbi:MAG: hypothetical protein AAGH78_05090 [Cyanobacteria bacterium P01_H01_bin.58]
MDDSKPYASTDIVRDCVLANSHRLLVIALAFNLATLKSPSYHQDLDLEYTLYGRYLN